MHKESRILLIALLVVLLIVFMLGATLSPLQYSRDKPVTMHEAYGYLGGP